MSAYTRELVERLLPTIWDRGYVWGMVDEYAPAPDMPKARGLKNRGNTLWAHLADIRTAWSKADLTEREAQSVVLCGGMGMTFPEAGTYMGVTKQAAQLGYERGVGRLMHWLNGTTDEVFDAEPEVC